MSDANDTDINALFDFAQRLADASGEYVRAKFRRPHELYVKDDASPVTEVDRAVETRLRAMIESEHPTHGIMGEEFGNTDLNASHVWIIDPIDGTKQFAAGLQTFGTLIALAREGKPILGIIEQPVTGERWVAAEGGPTRNEGVALSTRACPELSSAVMAASAPDYFKGEAWAAYERLNEMTRWTVYGGGCHGYAQLAAGFIDLGIEARNDPFDYCALVPIVECAGGVITDWDGAPLTIFSGDRYVAAGDASLHAQALEVINEALSK